MSSWETPILKLTMFWVKFGNGFISFGYKGLPDDMHFTVSLSEKSDDHNIHLARNIGSDPKQTEDRDSKNQQENFRKGRPLILHQMSLMYYKGMRDINWNRYFPDEGFLHFAETIVPKLSLKNEVHPDVVKAFRIINKLLTFSYFEYEFVEVAVSRAMHIFEMALKLRYAEINHQKWDRKPLRALIQWFFDNGYFEIKNIKYLDNFRNVRNDATHLEEHEIIYAPRFVWPATAVDLINDTYEDPFIRKDRMDECARLSQILRNFVQDGAVLEHGTEKNLIYDADAIFINNKLTPTIITLRFSPIFDVLDGITTHPPIYCEVNDPNLQVNEKRLVVTTNQAKVVLRQFNSNEESNEFLEWQNACLKPGSEIGKRIPIFDNTRFHELRSKFHFQ